MLWLPMVVALDKNVEWKKRKKKTHKHTHPTRKERFGNDFVRFLKNKHINHNTHWGPE